MARLYLTNSLLRDDNLWYLAENDASFVGVFTMSEFEALKTVISQKMCEVPDLKKEKGADFQQHITEILLPICLMGCTLFQKGK